MTESSRGTDRHPGSESPIPRAVLHKQILETAQQRPDASMKELADNISGATTSIVKRVLRQYGDPGIESGSDETEESTSEEADVNDTANTTDSSEGNESTATGSKDIPANGPLDIQSDDGDGDSDSEAATGGMIFQADRPNYESDSNDESDRRTQHVSVPDISELTEKQFETMRAIREKPTATQAELADELGVTSPTINQRVNTISGFDWSNRHVFVEKLFYQGELSGEHETETNVSSETTDPTEKTSVSSDNTVSMMDHDTTQSNTDDGVDDQQCEDLSSQVAELSDQIEALEQRVETQSSSAAFSDPTLAHKVIHACVTSDQISEEEELQILKNIIE